MVHLMEMGFGEQNNKEKFENKRKLKKKLQKIIKKKVNSKRCKGNERQIFTNLLESEILFVFAFAVTTRHCSPTSV